VMRRRDALCLREDQGDECLADWIHAEAQALTRVLANQNEALLRPTQHESRSDVRPNEDFRGGHGLGDNRAVGILDAACPKRRDADLFEELAWDLGEIGTRVNESFQAELPTVITGIPDRELHVKGPLAWKPSTESRATQ